MSVDIAWLYAEHNSRLIAFARSLSGSLEEAEDAVHDVFVKLLRDSREEVRIGYLMYQVRYTIFENWRKLRKTHADKSYAATLVPLEDTDVHELAAATSVEDEAEARLYLEAAEHLCPQIPAVIDAPPSEHRRAALRNIRARLDRDLESYIIAAYFGPERGNDRAERCFNSARECINCGDEFTSIKTEQQYCSAPECRRARANAKNRRRYARQSTGR